VRVGQPVTITFGVTVSGELTLPTTVSNEATIVGGAEGTLRRQAMTIVSPLPTYLPLGLKKYDQ